ncbi:MAG TPA: phosphate propanoyltransferase [Vicinamibacteria bacterium]|nr:phosphate propanoyltransferase [Vicinamibacteria bacterium]
MQIRSESGGTRQRVEGRSLDRAAVEAVVREVVTRRLGARAALAAPTLAVHASARHIHLSREHTDALFGPGYELTIDRPLYQPGNFAAKETVTLIGPRSRLISNLRILGPLRSRTQVELAFTDAISLGFDDVPIRLSGNLDGTPGAVLMGPQGIVELKEGLIRAAMHAHMNPTEAAHFGVRQGDLMRLRVGGEAGVTFERVHVRVEPTSRLDVHMDTDEANACGLRLTQEFELTKQGAVR